MKKIVNLLFGVLFAAVAFCGNAEASKMSCGVSVNHVSIEPIMTNGYKIWKVPVSSTIQCSHHNETNGLEQAYDTVYDPIVVTVKIDKNDTPEILKTKGSAKAFEEAYRRVFMEADLRLKNECAKEEFSCNCREKNCSCTGCCPPPPQIEQFSEEGISPQVKEVTKDENSFFNPKKLKNLKKIEDISSVQRQYIGKNYKGYSACGNMYTMRDGLYIHIVPIINEEGQRNLVYFDMTDVYKKLKSSRGKKAKMRVKELMESHMPLKDEEKK